MIIFEDVRTLARMHLNTVVLVQAARSESLLARRTSAAPQLDPVYDRIHIHANRYQFSTDGLIRDLARALDSRILHLPANGDTLLQVRQSPLEDVDIVPVNGDSLDPTAIDDRVQAVFNVSVARRHPKLTAYIASKSKHAARWRAMRAAGAPFISTWIDEDGPGESHMPSFWECALSECSYAGGGAYGGIVYVEPGETHKGSLVEMGALLAGGSPIVWVGPKDYLSALRHPNVRFADSPEEALEVLQVCLENERTRPNHSFDFTFENGELRMKLDINGIWGVFRSRPPFYSADFPHTALRPDTAQNLGGTTKLSLEVIHKGFVLDRKVWVDIDVDHSLPFTMPETVEHDLQSLILRSCKTEIHNVLSAPRSKLVTPSTP